MKYFYQKLSLVIFIFAIPFIAFSQPWRENLPKVNSEELTLKDYQKAFNDYWEPFNLQKGKIINADGSKKKAGGWKQFKRWEYIMESQIDPVTGNFPENSAYQVYLESQPEIPDGIIKPMAPGSSGNWTSLGPNSSTGGYGGVGRINCIAFHPTDNNIYWVGTPSGGIWGTSDNGTTWSCLSDGNATLGVSDIAIPSDYATSKTIYIATGDKDASDTYSIGVLKSTDGGKTWNTTGISYLTSYHNHIYRFLLDPSDNKTLLAATSDGVYKTTDGGETWDTQLIDSIFIDLEYKPGDFTTLYGSDNNGNIYKSVTDGVWTLELETSSHRVELATSAANSAYVYAIMSGADNGLNGIYKSTDSGDNFSLVFDGTTCGNNLMGYDEGDDAGGQGWYDLAIAASPSNDSTLLIGGINTWKSNDGGTTWTMMNHWYGGFSKPSVHADKHMLKFRSNGDLFECNDGGIYYSIDNGTSWADKTDGIAHSQIYKLGTAQTVANDIICGLQDNGTKVRYNDDWYDVIGGDGMECLIDYKDENIQYGALYYGTIYRTINHWATATEITPTGSEDGAWVTPYIINPINPKTLYAGYEEVYKTTNRGDSWTTISSFCESSNIRVMAIAPSDTNTIYIATTSKIWKTNNEGTDWTDLSTLVPTSSGITAIAVKDDDKDIVWITYGGYGSGKVYQSTNGGLNWTDISTGLPSIPVNTIIQNKISTGTELYCGTDVGVYHKLDDGNWTFHNTGLPNVVVRDLDIYYDTSDASNSRLRAATFGRGLWETELMMTGSYAPTASYDSTTSITETSCTLNGTITDDFGSTITASGFLYSTSPNITWGGSEVTTVSTSPTDTDGEFSIDITDLENSTSYFVLAYVTNSNGTTLSTETYFNTNCGTTTTLPYKQEFATGAIPPCWSINDNIGNGQIWRFNNPAQRSINTSSNENGFAIIDSDNYGTNGSQDCDLISPTFDFTYYDNIVLSFEHYFRYGDPSIATLFYSKNNGTNWNQLQQWSSSTSDTASYSNNITTEVSGESGVIFKWNYTAANSWYWAIDDISISADLSVPVNDSILNITFSNGEDECFGATEDIVVAGDGYDVIIEPDATANFIAGQSIKFLPGFHSKLGSQTTASITTTASFCDAVLPIVQAEQTIEKSVSLDETENSIVKNQDKSMKIYPNPNNGKFTIEMKNFIGASQVKIINMRGQTVNNAMLKNPISTEFDFTDLPTGLYYIQVRNQRDRLTQKIIIQ